MCAGFTSLGISAAIKVFDSRYEGSAWTEEIVSFMRLFIKSYDDC